MKKLRPAAEEERKRNKEKKAVRFVEEMDMLEYPVSSNKRFSTFCSSSSIDATTKRIPRSSPKKGPREAPPLSLHTSRVGNPHSLVLGFDKIFAQLLTPPTLGPFWGPWNFECSGEWIELVDFRPQREERTEPLEFTPWQIESASSLKEKFPFSYSRSLRIRKSYAFGSVDLQL